MELMPVHHFIDEGNLVEKGLRDYWGYNPLGFGEIPATEGQLYPLVCLSSFRLGRWMDLNETCLVVQSRKAFLLP